MLVFMTSMAVFMALYVSAAAGGYWYLLAFGMFVAMASVFVLSYRWGERRYETRTPEQLNAGPGRKPWWIGLFAGSGLMIFNAGGPVFVIVAILIPFLFSFVSALALVYYRRIAV